jgi:hypothetical protein
VITLTFDLPRTVTRDDLCTALQSVGIDPNNLANERITITRDHIEVEVRSTRDRESTAYQVHIPITD